MKTLMDESRRKSNLYAVTKHYYSLHHRIISEHLYLDDFIYNTKYERFDYYADMNIVSVEEPNLYYADAIKNNNYKYYFGLQDNSKSSETLYERTCEYEDDE